MKKLRAIYEKYADVIHYLVFGGLTTLVNFIVFYPLYNFTKLPTVVCNVIAWLAAVVFAFVTNKLYVFNSKDWSFKTAIPEMLRFFACRIGSGAFETVLLWMSVDVMQMNGNIMKLVASVIVVIANYFASRFFIFRHKENPPQ